MGTVRILVADDYQPWRRALFTLLEEHPEFQIVGEASDGLEAVCKTVQLSPDLIVLDIGMPELNGIEAARRISEIVPSATILFFSENRCPTVVQQALLASDCVRGYVLKSDAAVDLVPALQAMIQNKRFVSSRLVANFNDFHDL